MSNKINNSLASVVNEFFEASSDARELGLTVSAHPVSCQYSDGLDRDHYELSLRLSGDEKYDQALIRAFKSAIVHHDLTNPNVKFYEPKIIDNVVSVQAKDTFLSQDFSVEQLAAPAKETAQIEADTSNDLNGFPAQLVLAHS